MIVVLYLAGLMSGHWSLLSSSKVQIMLFKRILLSWLLISAGLFASINAQAQTLASAKILSSTGSVEIQRRSPQNQAALLKIAYHVNDELLAGDVVKTGAGARLVLGLLDGSQAIIGEKTIVEIADLSKSPRTIFNVLRGKTRIKIEKVGGRPNPYKVNTPTTVIAVRGTLFDVIVSEKETQVFVHEGEVAVSNFARPDLPVILSPGQRTRVQQARPPEPPSRFQPGRNNDTFRANTRDRDLNDGDHRRETRRGMPPAPPPRANPDPNQPKEAPSNPPPGRRSP
jgi:hypothetical protein